MIVSKKSVLSAIDSFDKEEKDFDVQISGNAIHILKKSSNYGGLATKPIDREELKKIIENMDEGKFRLNYCRAIEIRHINSEDINNLNDLKEDIIQVRQDYKTLSEEINLYKDMIEQLQKETCAFNEILVSSLGYKIKKYFKLRKKSGKK